MAGAARLHRLGYRAPRPEPAADFFGDIGKVGWPGQFNLDFLCFLALSAFWTAWRNKFTAGGVSLSLIAFFGGAGFLLPYLLWLSLRTRGDVRRILMPAD